jgi:hypothetical protein
MMNHYLTKWGVTIHNVAQMWYFFSLPYCMPCHMHTKKSIQSEFLQYVPIFICDTYMFVISEIYTNLVNFDYRWLFFSCTDDAYKKESIVLECDDECFFHALIVIIRKNQRQSGLSEHYWQWNYERKRGSLLGERS